MAKTHTIHARHYNTLQKAGLELLGFERHELGQPLFTPPPKTQQKVGMHLQSVNVNYIWIVMKDQCVYLCPFRCKIYTPKLLRIQLCKMCDYMYHKFNSNGLV